MSDPEHTATVFWQPTLEAGTGPSLGCLASRSPGPPPCPAPGAAARRRSPCSAGSLLSAGAQLTPAIRKVENCEGLRTLSFFSFLQCCGSGMFIPDPGSWFLPIPDPGSLIQKQEKREGWRKNCCNTFFWSHKFHKIVHGPIFKELQDIVTKLSIIWVWDPGSGKNLFRIPDPGVKKAPDPGSGSTTLLFWRITRWH